VGGLSAWIAGLGVVSQVAVFGSMMTMMIWGKAKTGGVMRLMQTKWLLPERDSVSSNF
jgi:hypothetical protein